jgi:hypothetical protein
MSLPERYEAVGIWVGKRFEEHAVYHAEDGGIGADSERQREDGDGGESGILAETTEGVADVLHEDFERDSHSDVADAFLHLFHAAEIAAGFFGERLPGTRMILILLPFAKNPAFAVTGTHLEAN